MSMQVSNNVSVNWQQLLSEINKSSGVESAQEISNDNRAVTFTTEENGAVATVTVNVPDDLDLPSEVTPESIGSLMTKLAGGDFNLTDEQLDSIKGEITKVYDKMASAFTTTRASSTGSVMFDLYRLMALMVEVAQSQRNAARDLRNTENQQMQNSIQAQADEQRNAAIVGLVVGVTCGVASALVSVGMLAGQSAAYKTQVSTARASGVEAAQSNVTMLKGADTVEHAQAQLTKVTEQVGADTATRVTDDISGKVQPQRDAFGAARQNVAGKQAAFDTAQGQVTEARTAQTAKQTAVDQAQAALNTAKTDAGIPADKSASLSKQEYMRECLQTGSAPDEQRVAKLDTAIQAENRLTAAKTELQDATNVTTQKELALDNARDALGTAKADLETARGNYRAALKTAADGYADTYEASLSRKAPDAEIQNAKNDMNMARAYAYNELAQEGVSTAQDHRTDVLDAKAGSDSAAQQLNNNIDYRGALRRIETFTAINAINTSVGNMLQSMTQNITGAISSEATRMGAEQKKEEEELDQTKDLFNQAQNVIDSALQLMQAVSQAETQSMRDAIQA